MYFWYLQHEATKGYFYSPGWDASPSQGTPALKTQYCPLSISHCDLLAAIFVMLKIQRLLFTSRKGLINNRRLTPLKPKWQKHAKHNGQYWAFKIQHPFTMYTLGWREALWELSILPKNTLSPSSRPQVPIQGLDLNHFIWRPNGEATAPSLVLHVCPTP